MLCMMRVDAYDSPTDGGPDDKRLDWHLSNWAEWMKIRTGPRGFPTKTPGLRSVSGPDFEGMVSEVDVRLARAMDAIIDSLPLNERIAILRAKGLQRADVWRLREPWEVLVPRARVMIRVLMMRRRVE